MPLSNQDQSEQEMKQEDVSNRLGWTNKTFKNIFLLAMAWALTLTTSTLLTTIGPLSAIQLGASNSLAAFAVGTFLFGAALSSVPSAALFARYGRFYGFSVGCVCQIIGSIGGAAAVGLCWLPLVYVGCFFVGLGQGLGQFYRFSAIEVTPPQFKSTAVTYVLSGGVIAAFLGPVCASNTAHLDSHQFLGSYLIIALIGLVNEFTIYFVDFPKPILKIAPSTRNVIHGEENLGTDLLKNSNEPHRRSLREIVTQPQFVISCFVATIAHTLMVMLMSDVTLAMKDYGYSLSATSLVMELHFFSMFGPGFITGKLIIQFGSFAVAFAGGMIFGGSAAVFLMGTKLWNFYFGMILLGIGWNFSFSAGTVMLTGSYQPHEATRVQAINDFILFTIAGIGSLAAGFVYAAYGWQVVVYVCLIMAVVNLAVFAYASWKFSKSIVDDGSSVNKSSERRSVSAASKISTILGSNINYASIDHDDEESYDRDTRLLSFDESTNKDQVNTIRSVSVT